MPTFPVVFSQLADRLLATGALVSPHTMKIMSAAMSFLEAIDNPLDDDVATAAYATPQLKSDDAKQVAIALGISPDLIPRLTSTGLGVDHQLGQVLAMGSRSQAVVAATVLPGTQCLPRSAMIIGLQTYAGSPRCRRYKRIRLAQTLSAEMAKVAAIPRPEPARSEYVFSISIDLVGSTEAKTRVMNLAQGDIIKIHKSNERIYREFCGIERKFYEIAVSHQGASEAIDPSNFFTVKGIGDEIWILCAVAKPDIPGVGRKLIDASLQIATQSVDFLANENEDGTKFDPKVDYGKIELIRSPIKIFIDVVGHASNLGRMRDEGLMTTIPGLLKTFHRREPTPLEIATVVRGLCFSSYEPIGGRHCTNFGLITSVMK
ncbi:MAG: hypothetical protein M3178_01245 [Pseudomonadota bacterium]|nr:hypothetical protein [Pseudomonadota bacterium]